MNRIESIFADLRKTGRTALMPFLTAGYPTLEATALTLPALQTAGASICELGIPFSDPIADGPVIAASMTEALKHKLHPADIFAMVKTVRPKLNMGLVAMVSYTIVHRIGVSKFVQLAHDAGMDGFIFPDLPLEEAAVVREPVTEAGMISSLLIAPTTPDDRAAAIAKASTGFVYIVARTGITGERAELPPDLTDRLKRLRKVTDLPLTVGFGISTPAHVRSVTQVADAAIVGSALVKCMGKHKDAAPQVIAREAAAFVKDLAGGLK
ncbi:MAG: tryptophan synthase subunit alpha [Planctomycetes bacterium]|nr:tryptophan synthase subunit alpha [Planctomycetota bacterium]